MVCDANWHTEATANKFRDTLKLPLAGYRDYSSASFTNQGARGGYWSSSTSGTSGYGVVLSSTQVFPANYVNRALGWSVRCLAN